MRSTTDPLRGTHVALVPLPLVELRHLYEIATATEVAAGWPTHGRTVSLARFAALVQGPATFALVPPATGHVAGLVALVDLDERAAAAELCLFVDPRLAAPGLLAAEAVDLCLHHAFAAIGLAKVTLAVPPAVAPELARLARRSSAVTHEGTRRRQQRLGPVLVDLELYAAWQPPDRPHDPRLHLGDLHRLVAALAPTPPDVVHPGHRLVEDLGYDSLALLELIDVLDARAGPDQPVLLDDLDHPLTVADLPT